MECEVINY